MGKAVEFVKINKYFPGVHVLKDVSFSVNEGEVHALLGENGAGKSTLLNVLHGVYTEYDGTVRLHDEVVKFTGPNDAIVNGKISKVHQETLVVKDLTVGQNVTLGYEPKKGLFINFAKMHQEVGEILQELDCRFKSSDLVSGLTSGEMQMLAIARALYHKSTIISLDEPTASLTMKETKALFEIIRKLKSQGVTIAGMVMLASLGSAEPTAGTGYETNAIAAAAIGGTRMAGGKGTAFGTFIGGLMLAILKVGMVVINVDSFWQYVVTGIIIIVASYFEFVQQDFAVFMARRKKGK